MIYDIYYIDWIFIDTLIIVLLFLLLLGVKIFKITHRWRFSFSNQALEHLIFPKTLDVVKNHLVFTKKWSFTRNSSLKVKNYPLILIIRTNHKRKFIRILTEALCSYGFNVINLKVQIKPKSQNVVTEKNLINDINLIISTVIDFCKKSKVTIKSNYIVLNHSKSCPTFNPILSDNTNKGIILINPKINKQNLKNYFDTIEEFSSKPQIYSIFSRNSIFLLKNYNLLKFKKKFYPQHTNILKFLAIKKAKNSFKNYETILLGILIDVIENKLFNSKNYI